MNVPENTPAFQRDQAVTLAERVIPVPAWEALERAERELRPAFESQPPGQLQAVFDAIRGTLAAPRLLEPQRAALIGSYRDTLLALTPTAESVPVRHLRTVEAG